MCDFFVVLGNGQGLLDMPSTETLDALTTNSNTTHTQNEQIYNKTEDQWH